MQCSFSAEITTISYFFFRAPAKHEKNDFLSSALDEKGLTATTAPRAAFAARGALSCCGHAAVPHCGYASASIHAGAARKFRAAPAFSALLFLQMRSCKHALQIRREIVWLSATCRRRIGGGKRGTCSARVSPLKTSSVEKPLLFPKRMSVYGLSPTIVTRSEGTPSAAVSIRPITVCRLAADHVRLPPRRAL